MQCKYLEEAPEMVSEFKCKSLAIIYNYFKRSATGFKYKKESGEELKEFSYNSDKYSVEYTKVENIMLLRRKNLSILPI